MFDAVGKKVVEDVMTGYNCTLMTYGQTGSGKTHTLLGSELYDEQLAGLIPRTAGAVFK